MECLPALFALPMMAFLCAPALQALLHFLTTGPVVLTRAWSTTEAATCFFPLPALFAQRISALSLLWSAAALKELVWYRLSDQI